MYMIESNILGFQFHPEFIPQYQIELMKLNKAVQGTELQRKAEKSYKYNSTDNLIMQTWITNFITQ